MKKNHELVFPVIRGEPLPPRLLNMDEIDAWFEEDFRLFFNRELYEREKRRLSVAAPFRL